MNELLLGASASKNSIVPVWKYKNLPFSIGYGGGGFIYNGEFYFNGGYTGALSSNYLKFNPATEIFTTLDGFGPAGYHQHVIWKGIAHNFGGLNSSLSPTLVHQSLSIPDGTVTQHPNMPALTSESSGVLVGDIFYVFTDIDSSTPILRSYNMTTGTWSIESYASVPGTNSAPFLKSQHRMIHLDGNLHVVMAAKTVAGAGNASGAFSYNIATKTYSPIVIGTGIVAGGGVLYTLDGKVYSHSGRGFGSPVSTEVSLAVYDPVAGTYQSENTSIHGFTDWKFAKEYAAWAANEEYVFAAGGYNGSSQNIIWMKLKE